MKLKDKKNILNMTFDNMNMSEERSEEIIRELINYNKELENKEEKETMKGKKVSAGENLHEISPDNNKIGRWQYAVGSLCILAVAVLGVFIWNNAGNNDRGNKNAAGSSALDRETTDTEESADNTTNGDTVFFVENGKDGELSAVIIPSPSSKDLIYEINHGNITMRLAKDYNYDIYSKETADGLEMLAVGVRKRGDTYTYVYSKQLKMSDSNTTSETSMAQEDATAQTAKQPNHIDNIPDFIGVSLAAGEKYAGRRDEVIDELSSFYNTVNEFIAGMEPEVSYKQEGIEGELPKGGFEYEVLQKAEASYVTCGVKDPIKFRFEGYFSYIDENIGQ